MKIMHILEAGRYSGPNRTIINICSSLRSEEYHFYVCYSNDDSRRFGLELAEVGIPHEAIKLSRLRGGFVGIFSYLTSFPFDLIRLYRRISSFRPDVIHVHTFLDFKGLIIGRLMGIKVIWHLHLDACPPSFWGMFCFFKGIHNGSYVAVSQLTNFNFLNEQERLRSRVIQSSVDIRLFSRSLDNSIKKNRVICVANYHKRKNLELVLGLAAFCLREELNFNFTILGGVYGKNNDEYNRLFNLKEKGGLDNVNLLQSDLYTVQSVLDSGDIFLLPSLAEASPFVVWEAASMGLPIVSTDVGDVKSFIEEYNCGRIFDRNNSFEQILKEILKVQKDFDRMSSNALIMAKKEFALDAAKAKYKHMYESN